MEKTMALSAQWEILKQTHPKVRIRDAARQLGTTEAELLATGNGEAVIRLRDEFREILQAVAGLGKVMALTRNDYCVHERNGVYTNLSFSGPMGLAVNPDIDLRLFMNAWGSGFAVTENGRKSLQFFGKDGAALHKIYLLEESDHAAYEKLTAAFRAGSAQVPLQISSKPVPAAEQPDENIQLEEFQQGWLELKDTHDFHALLRKAGVSRTQGLRLAPAGYAVQITAEALKTILYQVSAHDLEIMVFTGSSGCIQIHTGSVKHLVQTGPWFNVLDPDFNLHLRMDAIDTVWVVQKPTTDGIVTSIEVFDRSGGTIVQFFGKRKPGIPENAQWRALVMEFSAEH